MRCTGTKTSSAIHVLLPVPRKPTVCQVSSRCSSEVGARQIKRSAIWLTSSTAVAPSNNHFA